MNHDLISSTKTRWLVLRIKHLDRNKPQSVPPHFCYYYNVLFNISQKPVRKSYLFLNYQSLNGLFFPIQICNGVLITKISFESEMKNGDITPLRIVFLVIVPF